MAWKIIHYAGLGKTLVAEVTNAAGKYWDGDSWEDDAQQLSMTETDGEYVCTITGMADDGLVRISVVDTDDSRRVGGGQAYIVGGVEPALALEATAQSILDDTAEIGTAGAGLTAVASATNLALITAKLPSKSHLAGTANADGDIQMNEATGNFGGSVGSVAGNVGGNVTGTIGGLATQAKEDVNAEADTALADAKAAYAAAIEAAILDEGDATALLAAIGAKVEEFLINDGDASATLAAIATAVWSAATRRLTDGTNIVLAKDTGITGFNDLSASGVRDAIGMAAADMDDQLATLATSGELEALQEHGDAEWAGGGGSGGSGATELVATTIATLTSQTVFTLSGGSADDDAYNGALVVITDQSTATQKSFGVVSDYVGASKTVTLAGAPKFTVATGDGVVVVADASVTAAHSVTITPVQSTVSSGQVVSSDITAYKGETKLLLFTLVDSNGEPVDETGDTLVLVVRSLTGTLVFQESGTVGGVSGNQIAVTVSDANTATVGTYRYELWNTTEDVVRARGAFEVVLATEPE